ncbi:MAG: hypothetical protein R3C15_17945 [Thermoleophilia bacterium]
MREAMPWDAAYAVEEAADEHAAGTVVDDGVHLPVHLRPAAPHLSIGEVHRDQAARSRADVAERPAQVDRPVVADRDGFDRPVRHPCLLRGRAQRP